MLYHIIPYYTISYHTTPCYTSTMKRTMGRTMVVLPEKSNMALENSINLHGPRIIIQQKTHRFVGLSLWMDEQILYGYSCHGLSPQKRRSCHADQCVLIVTLRYMYMLHHVAAFGSWANDGVWLLLGNEKHGRKAPERQWENPRSPDSMKVGKSSNCWILHFFLPETRYDKLHKHDVPSQDSHPFRTTMNQDYHCLLLILVKQCHKPSRISPFFIGGINIFPSHGCWMTSFDPTKKKTDFLRIKNSLRAPNNFSARSRPRHLIKGLLLLFILRSSPWLGVARRLPWGAPCWTIVTGRWLHPPWRLYLCCLLSLLVK